MRVERDQPLAMVEHDRLAEEEVAAGVESAARRIAYALAESWTGGLLHEAGFSGPRVTHRLPGSALPPR